MIEEAFAVATEFRFDIGQAMLGTKNLQGAVDDLSKSANNAMSSLDYLAGGLVARLGFGSGGLLTVLTKAITLSEEFNQGVFGFVNSISSSFRFLGGNIVSFNDKLNTSKMLMDNITDVASDLGLNPNQLAMITQQVSGPLAAQQRLGTNYEGGIGMAKNIMVGAQAMGMHPQMVQESMIRGMQPGQAVGGRVFERFMGTQAFQNAKIMHPNQLANMNIDKKFTLLSEALKEVGGNADFLAARSQMLSVQFETLKNQVYKIIRPIGDAIAVPLRKMMGYAVEYLKTNAPKLGQAISKLIGDVFDDPKKLFVNLMQLKSFGSDFKKALHLTELFQMFTFLTWGLSRLGIVLNGGLIRAGLNYLVEGLTLAASWLWRTGIIGRVFSLIGTAVAEVIPIFASFLFIFQILSRARAIGKLAEVGHMLDLLPRLADVMVRFKAAISNILMPLNMAIDFWANLLAPLFDSSTYLSYLVPMFDSMVNVLEYIGMAVVYAMGVLSGFTALIIGFVTDLANLKNPLTDMAKNASEGYQDFMKTHPFSSGDMSKAVVNQVTNVGKIEARFDMREQLEPDRIAFAVTTHLKKLALNPTQGRGQSTNSSFATPNTAGAR